MLGKYEVLQYLLVRNICPRMKLIKQINTYRLSLHTKQAQLKQDCMTKITDKLSFHTKYAYLMHEYMTELIHECMT